MTIGKILVFAVIGFVFFHAVRFRMLIDVGIGLSQKAQKFERKVPGAPMRILVAGDSSAVGTGASNADESIAGRLGQKYPNAEVVNIGVNGLRLAGLSKLLENPPSGTFDLMVIQIGGNDINYRTPLEVVEKELRDVILKAKALSPKVVVLHTGDLGTAPIFPPLVGHYISYRTRLLRAVYLRVAPEMGARYVDIYAAPVDELFKTDFQKYYAADSFHLSGEGYAVWFEEVKKVLANE